jgi:TRAP-type C4-dicarboxylate transport system permease small subunit
LALILNLRFGYWNLKVNLFTMDTFLRSLTRFDHLLAKAEAGVLIMLVVVMTVIVFLQVACRYVLIQPLHWSEELARYLFIWPSILEAALGLQKRGHFGLDFFYRMLPDKERRFLQLLVHLLMGGVILVILIQGVKLVHATILQKSPAMEISMGWAYACLPVGAGLMVIHLLVIFLKGLLKR